MTEQDAQKSLQECDECGYVGDPESEQGPRQIQPDGRVLCRNCFTSGVKHG